MKALFFTLIFQILFQFVSFNVFASEFCNSDSVLIKSNLYKNENSLSSNLVSENQVPNFEKLNVESDSTKKEETTIDTNKKQKKIKKNRGKLLAVFTFLSGGLSIILSTIAVVMAMTHSAGVFIVLGVGLGLMLMTFLLGYFAYKKLIKLSEQTNQSYTLYHLLTALGIYAALAPLTILLSVLALLLISWIQGDLYM